MQPDFAFSDFLAQIRQIKSLGSIGARLARRLGLPEPTPDEDEAHLRRLHGVFDAMTPSERAHAEKLPASRRRRIANGAGVRIIDVSQVIRQFEIARDLTSRARTFWWRRRPDAVLGLVTHDPHHRDPSAVYPVGTRAASRRFRLAIGLIVFFALFVMTYAAFHGR